MMTLEQIVGRIAESAGLSVEEIMERVRRVQQRFELLTPEGAARIVAQELGVRLETSLPVVRPLKIEDLAPGMSRIDLVARVVRIYPVREFEYSSGRRGKRGGVLLQDSSGTVRMALWDDQVSILEEGALKKGDAVRIKNGYVVKGLDGALELRLGLRGSIEVSPDDPRVHELPPFEPKVVKISELKPEMGEVDVLGRVMSVSEARTVEKPGGGTGRVVTLMLYDGTGVVRTSVWNGWAELASRLSPGRAVMLENAKVRRGYRNSVELSVGGRSRIVVDPEGGESLPPLREQMWKVKDIEPGMPSIDIALKIKRVFPKVEFKRPDGSTACVVSAIGCDETGSIRVSFWDAQARAVDGLRAGDIVVLKNSYSRVGLRNKPEVHVGRDSKVEINPPGVAVDVSGPTFVKLGDIDVGDEGLEVVGRVLELEPVREFVTPDGRKGKVASAIIADETASVRINFWHGAVGLLTGVSEGDVLRISDVYCTAGLFGQPELHLSQGGTVEKNPPGVSLPPTEELRRLSARERRAHIGELEKEGERVEIRGTIVQVIQKKPLFYACPECGRGVFPADETVCENCNRPIKPEARAVVSFVCDDGTGNMRVTLFGALAERVLGLSIRELSEKLKSGEGHDKLLEEADLLGREVVVRGITRYDSFSDSLELRAFDVREADPKAEIGRLLEEIKEGRSKEDGEPVGQEPSRA